MQNGDDLYDFENQTFKPNSNTITMNKRDYFEYREIEPEEIDVPPYSVIFPGLREQKIGSYKRAVLLREPESVGDPFSDHNKAAVERHDKKVL